MSKNQNSGSNRQRGFTLVEIMVILVIIGLLASIAIPGFTQSRRASVASRTANDIKKFADQFTLYNLRLGEWPEDGLPASIPSGMEQLQNGSWGQTTAIGGNWDWDFQALGFTAGVSIQGVTAEEKTLLTIDSLIDDGNLNTGSLVRFSSGHIGYILEH